MELGWYPTGPLGEHLSLDVVCDAAPCGQDGASMDDQRPCCIESSRGKSSRTIGTARATAPEGDHTWTGDWESRVLADYGMVGTYDLTGVDVGVTHQQSSTYYVTVLHKAPAPEGHFCHARPMSGPC